MSDLNDKPNFNLDLVTKNEDFLNTEVLFQWEYIRRKDLTEEQKKILEISILFDDEIDSMINLWNLKVNDVLLDA